jgi:hypothetical protein
MHIFYKTIVHSNSDFSRFFKDYSELRKADLKKKMVLPLAMTRAGTPVAAMAETMAYLFWATLTLRCHLR